MIWDSIYVFAYLLNWWLCIILRILSDVFEQRYDKYVFYELSIMKWGCVTALLWVLFREKFLRLTMGFGYFMYFYSLVPVIDLWISGRAINAPRLEGNVRITMAQTVAIRNRLSLLSKNLIIKDWFSFSTCGISSFITASLWNSFPNNWYSR